MRDATEVVAILDRSGSMANVVGDAIGGFNTFLKDQQKLDREISLRVVLFDDHYETYYDGNIKDAPEMNEDTYVPRGMTALRDAIGRGINETGEKLAKLSEEERPNKVIFVILTDGLENASREFAHEQINDMITHQKEKYSWEFVFLAANQDAIATGSSLGFAHSVNYCSTGVGTRAAFKGMSRGLASYAVSGVASAGSFAPVEDDEEEEDDTV